MPTIYARVSEEIKKKIEEEAKRNGISISEQVRTILENYFKEGEGWLRERDLEKIEKIIRKYTILSLAISEEISICPKCGSINDKYEWFCKKCSSRTVKGSDILKLL